MKDTIIHAFEDGLELAVTIFCALFGLGLACLAVYGLAHWLFKFTLER